MARVRVRDTERAPRAGCEGKGEGEGEGEGKGKGKGEDVSNLGLPR